MRIGLDEGADDFLTALRYAMPDDGGDDGTLSNAWRESLPLVVLRIRDPRPAHRPKPTNPPVEFETRFGRHAARDRPETQPHHAGGGHLQPMGTALRPEAALEHESIPLKWTGPSA